MSYISTVTGAKIHRSVTISKPNAIIIGGAPTTIEKDCVISNDICRLELGSNVFIDEKCKLCSSVPVFLRDHGVIVIGDNGNVPSKRLDVLKIGDNVRIGKNCILEGYILGDNCIIKDNVSIGHGAIIHNSSVVQEGSTVVPGSVFPPNSIIAGNPATLIGEGNGLGYHFSY